MADMITGRRCFMAGEVRDYDVVIAEDGGSILIHIRDPHSHQPEYQTWVYTRVK